VLLALVVVSMPAEASPLRRDPAIVFVREDPRAREINDAVDLWTVRASGGRARPLVVGTGWEQAPASSPDGALVAFDRSIFDPDVPEALLSVELWTIRVRTRARRNVAGERGGSSPAWSPDGRRLAFVRGDGVYVVRRDGTRMIRVARRDDPGTPAWSPDGRRLAFVLPGELRLVDAGGRRERVLARGAGSGTSASWSPDGRRIAYSGRRGVSVVPSRGGRSRLVGREFVAPAWSPDGRAIAAVREGTPREAGLFLLDPRTGKCRRLTRGTDTQPAWSPDGRRLAFRRGVLIGDVYVVGVTGGRPRNVTGTPRLDEREPAWRPT
jgi:Tol biopolymer transport system component